MGMRRDCSRGWRPKIACGFNRGFGRPENFQPRMGRQTIAGGNLFRLGSPRRSETKTGRGWVRLGVETHGCTVGYYLPRLRRWGRIGFVTPSLAVLEVLSLADDERKRGDALTTQIQSSCLSIHDSPLNKLSCQSIESSDSKF